MEAPLGVMGEGVLKTVRQSMLLIPEVASELDKLDCHLEDNFIEAVHLNTESEDDEQVMQVKCPGGTAWLHMEGQPPTSCEAFDYDPLK